MGQRSINTVIRLSNESEYRAALKNCSSELKNLKSQLALTSSEFRNNANSVEALTAKKDVLSKMYATQKEQIETMRGALEKATQTRDQEEKTVRSLKEEYAKAQKALADYGKEVDKNSEEYKQAEAEVNRLKEAVITHEAKLNSSANAVNKYSGQLNRAQIELNKLEDQQSENNRLLDEAKHSADGCATSIDRYGNATKKSVSAVEALASALVAGGVQQRVEDVAAALMECAEASSEFETAISKVYTLADNSLLSESKMKAGIIEISGETGKAAEEIGEAVYQALSAGVETANVLDFVRSSTKLSVAGFTDAANSVDVLTTILNSYGIEASKTEQVASKLVKTQDLGKITVDELGKVMGRVIPSAAAYNVNLDNIATSYAHMTASGINAENTTTYLSTMLDELADSGSGVAEVLKKQTGKSFADLMGSGESLGDVLGILSDSVNGNKTEFSGLWSSATAGRGALALLNSGVEKFNATMNVMENSSGSVAVNFEKMAATSEFASQRAAVASKNLKIAVGDQLNPVLNELRNVKADLMQAAADVVAKSPVLVSAIAGVVTALGALTAGLSAMTILKTILPLMAEFKALLITHPIGIVVTAVASLGAALATLAANTKGADEELNALTESSRALADTVSQTNQSYTDSVASVDAAYDVVAKYIGRLEELEAQGLKTKNQQVEYAMIVDQINATIPELNASLDEQTGLVNGGTDALKRQADQWKKTAIQQAVYARYKDDIAALADAEYELAKNQVLKSNAEKTKAATTKQLTAAQEKLTYWTNELNNATIRDGETAEQFTARCADMRDTVYECENEVRLLQAAQSDNADQVALYSEAIDTCNKTIEEQKPAVDAATDAWKNMSDQVEVSAPTAADKTAEMAGNMSGPLSQVREEYEKLQESARQSLDTQFGLFEKVELKCEMSTEDMIKALQSQKKAFDDYATNITLAIERGVDIGLVQQLSDGSAESMAILAQLVTGTDEEIGKMNAAFHGVDAAKDTIGAAINGAKKVAIEKMEEMSGAMHDGGYAWGSKFGDGAISGLRSKKPAYDKVCKDFMLWDGPNNSRSVAPSKFQQNQRSTVSRVATYRQSIPQIESLSARAANARLASAIRVKQQQIPHLAQIAVSAPANNQSSLESKLDSILAAIKDGKVIAIDGKYLVGATADQYDAQMGQMRMLKERGAK